MTSGHEFSRWMRIVAILALPFAMASAGETDPGRSDTFPAPVVDLSPLGGEHFALADLQGRVVVLDFWATWCHACIVDLPQVIDTVNEFADDQVALWTVNRMESDEVIKEFMREENLEFPVSTDRDSTISKAFKVMVIPHLVVIDREGVVRHVHVGRELDGKDYLKKEIEALLDDAV
ncbi:MAG: redoxin domain-containing protein [Acidobacteriota bacterium]